MSKEISNFYSMAYKKGLQLNWTSGTASPELVDLVYKGKIKKGSKIMELGCGLGAEAIFMAARGMNVTAIDLSEDALSAAKKIADCYGVSVNWKVANVLEDDLGDEQYDVITDQGCYHHMEPEEKTVYLEQVVKHLKPGGMFVLRCFSDKFPPGGQPKRISSDDMIATFHKDFVLEHMELVLSFSSDRFDKPLGWFTVWYKR